MHILANSLFPGMEPHFNDFTHQVHFFSWMFVAGKAFPVLVSIFVLALQILLSKPSNCGVGASVFSGKLSNDDAWWAQSLVVIGSLLVAVVVALDVLSAVVNLWEGWWL
jgi:hypothetical protein